MAQNSSPDGNPKAAQTRIGPASAIKTGGQRKHDLRIDKQPDYVDDARAHLNRVLNRGRWPRRCTYSAGSRP